LLSRPLALIRQAEPQDAPGIRQVLKAAVTTLLGRPYTRAQIDAWIEDEEPENFTEDLALGRAAFVALAERRVIGFARISWSEVEALYVHPAETGRRVGLRLLSELEKSAASRDVRMLRLDAAISAKPFYESAGYRSLGPSLPVFDNGVALPCIRMQKTLRAARPEKCHPRNQSMIAVPSRLSAFSSVSGFSRRML
jgi:putative acetyltransferase